MAFFDFLRQSKAKKPVLNELLRTEGQSIFPNGKAQIDKSLQEIYDLLEQRYTKQDLLKPYIHATSMCSLATIEPEGIDPQNIITSILLSDSKIALSRADAEKIYELVQGKLKPKL